MITLLAQFDLSQKYFCISPGISLSLLSHHSFACTCEKISLLQYLVQIPL